MKKFKQVLSLLLVIVMLGTSVFIMSCNDNDENDGNDNNDDLTNIDTNDEFEWDPHELDPEDVRADFDNLALHEFPIVINSVAGRPSSRLNDGVIGDRGDEYRWATDTPALSGAMGNEWYNGYRNVWFGVSFANPTTVDTLIVVEAGAGFPGRAIGEWIVEVATYAVEPNNNNSLDDDGWLEVANGTGIGELMSVNFHPVTTNYIRIRSITTVGDGWPPSVVQFEAYNVSGADLPHVFDTIEWEYVLPATGSQMRASANNIALYPYAHPIAISTVGTRPLERLNDGDFENRGASGRWATDTPSLRNALGNDWYEGYRNIWFGVNLLEIQEFNALVVTETSDDARRVGDWVIEIANELPGDPNDNRSLSGEGWTVVLEGNGVGDQRVIHLDESVSARYVRMRSTTTTGNHNFPPSMVQFEVFYAIPAPPQIVDVGTVPAPPIGERDTVTLNVQTIPQSMRQHTANAGLQRSNGSDHQPLGYILPANHTVRVRQANPNFGTNLTLDTWGTRNHSGAGRASSFTIPASGEWVQVRSQHPRPALHTVLTVRTPFVADGFTEVPVLEFEIFDEMWELPVYEYSNSRTWNANNRDFTQVAAWDAWNNQGSNTAHINFVNSLDDEPFALIQGNSINILLNAHDIEHSVRARLNGPNGGHLRHFVNFDQLLGYYDHMTAMFDFWSGLDPSHHADSPFSFIWEEAGVDFDNIEPYHTAPHTRFFSIADQGGVGAGYWAGTHIGQSSAGQESFYLRRGWGGLHEVGHSYQGRHKGGRFGEVWNNILAHTYQLRYVLPTHPLVAFPGQTLEASREHYARDFANSTDTVPSGYGMNSWMWGNVRPSNGHTVRSRENAETEMHRRRHDASFDHHVGFENNLFILVQFTEAIGEANFREINRVHREMQVTNQHGINDLDIGAAWVLVTERVTGIDFTNLFAAYNFIIPQRIRDLVADGDSIHFLMDVVTNEATRVQIVEANGLVSQYSLVTGSQLRAAGVAVPN